MGFVILIGLVAILAILAFVVYRSLARSRAIAAANAAYAQALAALRADPGNTAKREAALRAGRYFSTLARQSGGRTLFDEARLSNDLAAIPVPPSAAPTAPASTEARLRELTRLRDTGVISAAEYDAQRREILGGL